MIRRRPIRVIQVVTFRAATALLALILSTAGCASADPAPEPAGTEPRASSRAPEVGEPIAAGRAPAALAVGAGAVWVASNTDGTVSRLDPVTRRPMGRPVAVSPGPRALSFGAGAAWVATGSGTVERVTASASAPTASARVTDPSGLAVAGDRVWVSSRSEDAVVPLDARTGRPMGAPVGVGRGPTDVAATGSAVWVANSEDGSISRIDAESGRASAPVRLTDGQVLALTAGEGGLWAAVTEDPLGRRVDVLRLDPGTGERRGAAVRVAGGVPTRLAAGEGAVWVINAGVLDASGRIRGAKLRRLDLDGGGALGAPIDVGERPAAIAVGEGSAWVADQAADAVIPVRPR